MNKTKNVIADIAGWYATIAILLAYTLVSFQIITGGSWIFQLLNLTGGIGFVFLGLVKHIYQTAILNGIWALVAFISIMKLILSA